MQGNCCEGSWIDCIQSPNYVDGQKGKHGFFRHIPSCKHFTQGDVAKLCPICWFIAHKRNNPIPAGPRLTNAWIDHLQKYKPGPDTL